MAGPDVKNLTAGVRLRALVLTALLALTAVFALLAPAPALASSAQMSVMQDDDKLIFSNPDQVAASLNQLASLGVGEVRVSLYWAAIAPDPTSTAQPSFDATDPAAYPAGAWDRYDTLVRLAAADGIAVNFDITSPIPRWASIGLTPTPGLQKSYNPSPSMFGQFVTAIGRRYSGTFVPGPAPPPPPPPSFLGIPLSFLMGYPPVPASPAPLPRVSSWSIWNEPNEAGWLTPQWRRTGRTWTEAAPGIYRNLVGAGVSGLQGSGHGDDQVLIGETAARGSVLSCNACSMRPMVFLRALYCVGGKYQLVSGTRASLLGCPPGRMALPAQYPSLFTASGFGHHPYAFTLAPNASDPDRNDAPLYDLGRLESGLDRIFAAYHRPKSSDYSLYLDEYGYKSDPPNPFAKFSQAQQAAFINEGEYLGYRDPRVRSMAQFLLVDDAPKADAPVGSVDYWSTFQTGLITLQGVIKPAYAAYRIPIWLPVARHGHPVVVWGQLRPAPRAEADPLAAQIQFRPRGGHATFATIANVQTANPEGFFAAHVPLPSAGQVRIAWPDPATGAVEYSRTVTVS